MSNMSYCRFQNTSDDFRDCDEALEELIDGSGDALSEAELNAAKSLAKRGCSMVERLAEVAGIDVDLSELVKNLPETLDGINGEAGTDDQ
jgi:hypothetical protein